MIFPRTPENLKKGGLAPSPSGSVSLASGQSEKRPNQKSIYIQDVTNFRQGASGPSGHFPTFYTYTRTRARAYVFQINFGK